MHTGRTKTVVDADVEAGNRLGVIGTPTLLINGEQYLGIPRGLDRIIRRHLAAPGDR
jgi:protein-disulfide isomerase